ncbi:hypothetical protein K6Q96_06775 [Grimontia kaedaensis]|uniref:Uncharacterized protein n=1 Tax=Grimontia kaedaensis TaxID=2872157 RepID=A0ABY4WXI0_9GAMM|nr:hypothetical protein [Grimontia kaedaensis]USH03691.1 hypothetical protein K6Q96_06775 [Grimontia kaedaensis]
MKKSIIRWLATSVILPSSLAYSAGAADYNVVAVGCFPQGTCYVQIEQEAKNTSCPLKNQIRFNISLPGSQAQYSAALSALLAGKTINVYLTDSCIDDFPIPDWLQVNK